jgi:hypothetical protein
MGLFDGAWRTGSALGTQGGEIVGIKGGKNGWLQMAPGGPGFIGAFHEGGLIGLGKQMKHFFGFGFERGMGFKEGMGYYKTIGSFESGYAGLEALERRMGQGRRVFYTGAGGARVGAAGETARTFAHSAGLAPGGGVGVSNVRAARRQSLRGLGQLTREAPDVFRRRRVAGAVGGGVGLVAAGNVIGYGNMFKMGAAWGAGAMIGGAGMAPFGGAAGTAGRAAYGAAGRRWGGRLGLAAAGLGIVTGLI